MVFQLKPSYDIADLIGIMKVLREHCPWDRDQTHSSIRKNVIEEAYEVADAIDKCDAVLLCEELGDLLLQVVFHSRIAQDDGAFDIRDVADGICKKLILRHPHIFSDVKVKDADEVLDNWDAIKKKEKNQTTSTESPLAVPKNFPALMRSQKVQKRAAKTGFDYPDVQMALDDLEKEIAELREAIAAQDRPAQDEEIGDVIFSAVNVSRMLKIDAEESLFRSCDKFIDRFSRVEALAAERHVELGQSSIERLNSLWREAKRTEDGIK